MRRLCSTIIDMEIEDIPIIGGAIKWLNSEDIDYGLIVIIVGLLVIIFLLKWKLMNETPERSLGISAA